MFWDWEISLQNLIFKCHLICIYLLNAEINFHTCRILCHLYTIWQNIFVQISLLAYFPVYNGKSDPHWYQPLDVLVLQLDPWWWTKKVLKKETEVRIKSRVESDQKKFVEIQKKIKLNLFTYLYKWTEEIILFYKNPKIDIMLSICRTKLQVLLSSSLSTYFSFFRCWKIWIFLLTFTI